MASNVTRTTRRDGIQFGANGYLSLADNEIDVSSGDLTLDVAGTIILNADSGSINLVDASTTFAELVNSSSDFIVKSSVPNPLIAERDPPNT